MQKNENNRSITLATQYRKNRHNTIKLKLENSLSDPINNIKIHAC